MKRFRQQLALVVAIGVPVLRLIVRTSRELRACLASDAQMGTRWTTIPGLVGSGRLRMHARVRNDAVCRVPPIVLVHGFGVASSYFLPLAARLSRRAHVYVPELPGHGLSDHDARPLDVRELATALSTWMDAEGLDAPVLVGHSLGCQVVAEVARRRGVAAMVLLGPTSDPAARTTLQHLGRVAVTWLFERPSLAVWLLIDYTRAGVRVLLAEGRSMLAHRLEEVLPHVHVPAQVARGGRDAIAPQQWAETASRLMRAPPPLVIPGWGHAVQYDDPDSVSRLVLRVTETAAAVRISRASS